MEEIINLLKKSSPIVIILVVIAYFFKFSVEKKIENAMSRVEEIAKTSLTVKQQIREEERTQLVELRVAIEKWSDFLLTGLIDYTMSVPSEMNTAPLHDEDKKLFLDVKIAVVKTSVYLRDKNLENQLMSMIIKIKKSYDPLINESLPPIIDIQAKLMPIDYKMKKFRESGFQDMKYALTQAESDENKKLQDMLTEQTKIFADKYVKLYPQIAVQMESLKEVINDYIYRPIREVAVDKE